MRSVNRVASIISSSGDLWVWPSEATRLCQQLAEVAYVGMGVSGRVIRSERYASYLIEELEHASTGDTAGLVSWTLWMGW